MARKKAADKAAKRCARRLRADADAAYDRGIDLVESGRYDEAEPLMRQAYDVRRRIDGDRHLETANVAFELGRCLTAMECFDEAVQLQLLSHALDVWQREPAIVHTAYAQLIDGASYTAGICFSALGRYAEAEPLLRRALEATKKVEVGAFLIPTSIAACNLGVCLNGLCRYDEADRLLRPAVDAWLRAGGELNGVERMFVREHAACLVRLGRGAEVRPLLRSALKMDGCRWCFNPACAAFGQTASGSRRCKLYRCARCFAARYCGKECQGAALAGGAPGRVHQAVYFRSARSDRQRWAVCDSRQLSQ